MDFPGIPDPAYTFLGMGNVKHRRKYEMFDGMIWKKTKVDKKGRAVLPKKLRKKVMRAVTDSGPTEMNQEKPEPIQNLFTLMEVVSTPDTVSFFDEAYNNCTVRYGDLKKQLAEDIISFTTPSREKILSLTEDTTYLRKVTSQGAEAARESAARTIREVREIIGFKTF